MLEQPTVILINNEPTFRWTMSRLLERRGYEVTTHERDAAAIDQVRVTRPAAVVLEATYGSAISATTIVERLRDHRDTRYVPIVVCSPDGRFLSSYGEYLRGQGCVVVGRPFNDEQFIEVIENVATTRTPFADPFHIVAAHDAQ